MAKSWRGLAKSAILMAKQNTIMSSRYGGALSSLSTPRYHCAQVQTFQVSYVLNLLAAGDTMLSPGVACTGNREPQVQELASHGGAAGYSGLEHPDL